MNARRRRRFAWRLAFTTVCIVLVVRATMRGQIRPLPTSLTDASPELVARLRTDPFTYFRFVNRSWAARVCEAFADVSDVPIVRLHGDAHVEQYAFTNDAWGLVDFDDSARGPQFLDVVRFLGSIDVATRQRGWTRDRDAVSNRFFDGYRAGLRNPEFRPPEPDIVRVLRRQKQLTRVAFLAWSEQQMQPMDAAALKSVNTAMEAFDRFMRRERPDLPAGYFVVKRAGWLRLGVGSGLTRKVLVRVEGRTKSDDDDVLLEAKEVVNLEGVRCLESPPSPPALRIVDGARQLGRFQHEILAVGPTLLIPAAADRAEHSLDWWVSTWEPSYREVHLSDLRSVKDLADIVFDSGVQLGASESNDASDRKRVLDAVNALEGRFRRETSAMVDELMAGWRELAR